MLLTLALAWTLYFCRCSCFSQMLSLLGHFLYLRRVITQVVLYSYCYQSHFQVDDRDYPPFLHRTFYVTISDTRNIFLTLLHSFIVSPPKKVRKHTREYILTWLLNLFMVCWCVGLDREVRGLPSDPRNHVTTRINDVLHTKMWGTNASDYHPISPN
jgi:hypothetical protein